MVILNLEMRPENSELRVITVLDAESLDSR